MPVSSLPSPYGIGCFSAEAYEFVDTLQASGQTYWQLLPLGPTGYGDSPYQAFSAFAGNPYFIDLDTLRDEGLLLEEEYQDLSWGDDPARVDYGRLYDLRLTVLRKAFERFDAGDASFAAFREKNAYWLDDYSFFMALKRHFGGAGWTEWEDGLRLRDPDLLKQYRAERRAEREFECFLQYQFMRQWSKLKAYANNNGIRIIGDLPIYVSMDSVDSWANPGLFQFDEKGVPSMVAGCPPDAFSAEGQLWGNPLYDWEYHEKTKYAWWMQRIRRCFELYDVIRIDHFRGFDEYYAIPFKAPDASGGRWLPGPGMRFFKVLREQFPDAPVIAEDLGYLTDSVRQLVAESGCPGMKVMEFAFDSREPGDYMPYLYEHNCAVYTGTHDNQTLKAWYGELTPEDRQKLETYLDLDGKDEEKVVWAMIRLTLACVADTAVVPMQDYLCLGGEARMNRPSTLGTNWQWRMLPGQFTRELAQKVRKLTDIYGRV